MSTTTATAHPADETLARFVHATPPPGMEAMGRVCHMLHHRGDLTETGERRLRAMLAPEAYAHHHFDTWACNGRIALWVPRYKQPDAPEASMFKPEVLWAFAEINERGPLALPKPALRYELSHETRAELVMIPEVELIDIRKVEIWSYGATKRRVKQAVPQDYVYFRWAHGCGIAARMPKGGA